MNKLQKQSRRYKIFFSALFVAILILVPLFWITIQTKYDFFSCLGISQNFDPYISHTLSMQSKLLALCVSIIPMAAVLYTLSLLIRLFSRYQKLEVFSLKVVRIYKKLGLSLIYWFGAQIVYNILITLVLTFNNAPGHRFISITIGTLDMLALIVGAIIITIASVMKKAHEISEENELTI